MSLWTSTRTKPAVLVAGVALTLSILGYVVWAGIAPHYAKFEEYGPGDLAVVVEHGTCSPERYRLACERFAEAGWALCEVVPEGHTAEVVRATAPTPHDPRRGNPRGRFVTYGGVRHIEVAATKCDEATCAVEHEVGHAVHGLADCTKTGCAMNEGIEGHRIQALGVPVVEIGGQGCKIPLPPK